MNILFNFSTLKKGGGQNVGLNFICALFEIENQSNKYYFLVVKNSEIHRYLLKKDCMNIILTSSSPVKRTLLEIFKIPHLLKRFKIDIIYTYFGFALFTRKIPQVCGVAVSNIFFPEIEFWEGNLFNKIVKNAIDKYRIYGIKNATALIFENKAMEEKCHSMFKISPGKTIYIPPSFNPDFENKEVKLPNLNKRTTKLLMLCSWQRNKNILRVPEIAYCLKKTNQDFHFIITAPKNYSDEHIQFINLQKRLKVEDMITLMGPIQKPELRSLYSQIDFVLLMSKLESFSNNIIEAFYFKKPLIISNGKWSRQICKDAAYYINRDSPEQIAEALVKLRKDDKLQSDLIKKGNLQLDNYPSIKEKAEQEILFLKKIYNEF